MSEPTPLEQDSLEFESSKFDPALRQDAKSIPLRDEVLNRVGSYCSDLGQDLWAAYCANVIPNILAQEWNMEMQFEFLKLKRQMDSKGMAASGDLVLHRLRELADQ